MSTSNTILDFSDNDGKRYILTKVNYDNHSEKHPELKEPAFVKNIKNIVCDCQPDMIYPSYNNKSAFVYYEKLADTERGTWYNKVVIIREKAIYRIVTAFRYCGLIREAKYGSSLKKRP